MFNPTFQPGSFSPSKSSTSLRGACPFLLMMQLIVMAKPAKSSMRHPIILHIENFWVIRTQSFVQLPSFYTWFLVPAVKQHVRCTLDFGCVNAFSFAQSISPLFHFCQFSHVTEI